MRFISLFIGLISFIFSKIECHGQNLIVDPGFELTSEDCIENPPLEYWFSPNLATPDVWTLQDCGNLLTEEIMENLGVPLPFEGLNYMGMFCCYSPKSNEQTRDYVTTELTSPLENGQIYSVSFMLSRRVNRDLAIDRIGVYFSSEPPFAENTVILDVEPQLETFGTLLVPDLIWIPIQFFYTANGDEHYVTIGNFRDLDEMLWLDLEGDPNYHNSAYYLFDNFVVEIIPDAVSELTNAENCTFDPGTQSLVSNVPVLCQVFSTDGRLMLSENFGIGRHQIDNSLLVSGIYILAIKSFNSQWVYKFYKE